MSIDSKYNPGSVESKWYAYWLENKLFASKPNPAKKAYTVVIPPPNVTGVLHMGHMLNNSIQDVLVRRARMQGFEACWVPGTDHASIATEAKVVAKLKEEGIEKASLTREEFLTHAWAWKEKYGGIILEQLKKLGASCDWDRTRFTMEPDMSQAVIDVFVDLYNKGHIYQGVRMVNWDPLGKTALSDEEVYHKEVTSQLYYISYPLAGRPGETITVATTRPETIMADMAICVHPDDERYKHLVGSSAIVPLINREIPIITDEYIDPEFGTGCLKITPAHDINDYNIALKHKLAVLDILADDGTLNEKAQIYIGEDRFVVRKKIAKQLDEEGFLLKKEEIKNANGFSERTHAVIEPKLSLQWFLKMQELSKPALENVLNDEVQLVPAKFKNMYRSWMENVRDWCISRQLWWGQRIPAFYLPDGQIVVAPSKEQALEKATLLIPGITANELRQDEDVLDTWFSSWLWPISVFDGFKDPDGEEINYYYPTSDLVTAPEILFFWVARMIIAGYEFRGQKPFKNVYLTGIVRDKLGRKMSKSLGNSPDPLELIDLYGADAVRTGMMFSSPAGNDLPYDDKLVEQGRNFCNKIWNSYRLIKGLTIDDSLPQPEDNKLAIRWINARIQIVMAEMEELYGKFKISEALLTVYKLVWDSYCAWYLEMIKPAYGHPIDKATYDETLVIFERLLLLLHPFTPFITEELWQDLQPRKDGESICIAAYPVNDGTPDNALLQEADQVFELITQIRNTRSAKGISPKEALEISVNGPNKQIYHDWKGILNTLANINEIKEVGEVTGQNILIKSEEIILGIGHLINQDQEREAMQKDLDYAIGFRESVLKKLDNEKFVANAKPEVLEREKNKLADSEAKILALKAALNLN